MNLSNWQSRSPISHLVIVLLLLFLLIVGAAPSYLTGKWSWQKPAAVENLSSMRDMLKTGLAVPSWQTLEQIETRIGSHRWSVQFMQPENSSPLTLLLRPQRHHSDKPEVDWVDIQGFAGWRADKQQKLAFTARGGVKVKANFFRARTRQRTLAVLQWYANPKGGNPSPARWFWSDQFAQLRGQRLPWVAVCIQIPVKPLAKWDNNLPVAEEIAQTVENTLMETIFSPE